MTSASSVTSQRRVETHRIQHVEMRDIVKRFPGVLANDHGLLRRERGRGARAARRKRRGQEHADAPALRPVPARRGRDPASTASRASFRSPADAIRAGIGMIHQHFMLVPTLTVAENVALGLQSIARAACWTSIGSRRAFASWRRPTA